MSQEPKKVMIWAIASLVFVCMLFGAGMVTLVYAIVLEASSGEPVYVILAGIGAVLATLATFTAIVQQKVERLVR